MKSNNNESWFSPLFRIVGYALLALSLFDIIDIFVPARFIDPTWEFQMVSNLVERVPVPLLGLVFVFCGETNQRIFKFLSWACLIVGVLFLLLVPLGISSTWRINQQNQQQVTTQLTRKTAQLKQLQEQLSLANTADELRNILSRVNPQSPPPQINNPQQAKNQLLAGIAQTENKLKIQAETNQSNASFTLVKNALKSNLGALVSGVVFLSIWRQIRKILKVSNQRR